MIITHLLYRNIFLRLDVGQCLGGFRFGFGKSQQHGAESLAVKNATLMWPVRIAAAGKAVTPGGAVEICHILGRDECLRRLRAGLEKLN